jgi:hypothetical protein
MRRRDLTSEIALSIWADSQHPETGGASRPDDLSNDRTRPPNPDPASIVAYVESTPGFGGVKPSLLANLVKGDRSAFHRLRTEAFADVLAERLVKVPWEPPDVREVRAGIEIAQDAVDYAERHAWRKRRVASA